MSNFKDFLRMPINRWEYMLLIAIAVHFICVWLD